MLPRPAATGAGGRWSAAADARLTARIINPFIPQSVRDGRPEDLFRARVLVAVLIFNGLVFAVTRPLGAFLATPGPWPTAP